MAVSLQIYLGQLTIDRLETNLRTQQELQR